MRFFYIWKRVYKMLELVKYIINSEILLAFLHHAGMFSYKRNIWCEGCSPWTTDVCSWHLADLYTKHLEQLLLGRWHFPDMLSVKVEWMAGGLLYLTGQSCNHRTSCGYPHVHRSHSGVADGWPSSWLPHITNTGNPNWKNHGKHSETTNWPAELDFTTLSVH